MTDIIEKALCRAFLNYSFFVIRQTDGKRQRSKQDEARAALRRGVYTEVNDPSKTQTQQSIA